jgi:hypothetical protein
MDAVMACAFGRVSRRSVGVGAEDGSRYRSTPVATGARVALGGHAHLSEFEESGERAPGSDMNVDGSVTAVLDCFEDGAETRGVDE